MLIVRNIRARKILPAIEAERAAYGSDWRGTQAEPPAVWQLARFNKLWADITTRIPRYRDLVANKAAPREFDSWAQFSGTLPTTEKSDVRERPLDLTDPARPPEAWRITGGSTGEPTHMPKWMSESDLTAIDKNLGRGFYGVTPASKLFTIWGHHHLLGEGLKGKLNAKVRVFKDWLIGTCRFSAYDLSPAAMRRAGDSILSLRPDFIISYSGALELLARANEDRAAAFAHLKLKCAIGTGEVFPNDDGPALVSRVLGCPVAMEYGSVETDILAHTTPDFPVPAGAIVNGFRTFWRRYFLEVEPAGPGGERPLLVTSLYPRAMPLVRYRIGDFVRLYEGDAPHAITRFAAVIGRSNSYVELADGTRVHTMGVKHCVEGLAHVARFQIVQSPRANELRVILAGPGAPGASGDACDAARKVVEMHIRSKAAILHPDLAQIGVAFDKDLIQTRAGKTPLIAKID